MLLQESLTTPCCKVTRLIPAKGGIRETGSYHEYGMVRVCVCVCVCVWVWHCLKMTEQGVMRMETGQEGILRKLKDEKGRGSKGWWAAVTSATHTFKHTHTHTHTHSLQTNQFAHLPVLADSTRRSRLTLEYKSRLNSHQWFSLIHNWAVWALFFCFQGLFY